MRATPDDLRRPRPSLSRSAGAGRRPHIRASLPSRLRNIDEDDRCIDTTLLSDEPPTEIEVGGGGGAGRLV